MTETLAQAEAKYAQQLIGQDRITEQEMNALAAIHRANMEHDNALMESKAESKKAWLDFFSKILSAAVAGGITAGISCATRRDALNALDRVTEFEKTGTYTTSQGKDLVRKITDAFRI